MAVNLTKIGAVPLSPLRGFLSRALPHGKLGWGFTLGYPAAAGLGLIGEVPQGRKLIYGGAAIPRPSLPYRGY